MRPYAFNAYGLGTSSHWFNEVFAANGVTTTSDAREKPNIRRLTDVEIAASKELTSHIGFFQWEASVEEKGENQARQHCRIPFKRSSR